MPERFHAGSTNQSTSYFFRSSGFTPTTDSNMKSLLMSEIIDTVIADAPKQTLHFTLAFLCRECGVFFRRKVYRVAHLGNQAHPENVLRHLYTCFKARGTTEQKWMESCTIMDHLNFKMRIRDHGGVKSRSARSGVSPR